MYHRSLHLKFSLKSPVAKQINGYWRLLTGKSFEAGADQDRGARQRRNRRVSVLIALAVMASAGSAMAQRAVGIDVSDFQSSGISWPTLKNTYGISFAWAKASEGTCSTSCGGGNWPTYVANAKAAGVFIGPYHFARYDLDSGTNGANSEANFFWSVVSPNVKPDGLSLVPMLDVEETNTSGYSPTTMSQWVDAWCTTRFEQCLFLGTEGQTGDLRLKLGHMRPIGLTAASRNGIRTSPTGPIRTQMPRLTPRRPQARLRRHNTVVLVAVLAV